MSKILGPLVAIGAIACASNAAAAEYTNFSRATVTWQAQDGSGSEYDVSWTTATTQGCGTGCSTYRVACLLAVNTDNGQPVWKLKYLYARLGKSGTNGFSPYASTSWKFRHYTGRWTTPDRAWDIPLSSNARYYLAEKDYDTALTSAFDYEIGLQFQYTSGGSIGERRIGFSYVPFS